MTPPTASIPTKSPKITARQLQRRAYVYVRQSSPKQLYHHREGRENQYALVEHAAALGWPEEMIRVIDSDLGLSGQSSGNREGFKELVSEVSLGYAGIIFCYEASRLARNNADWYSLLDVAALKATLIADTDGVFDPCDHNDRMLLGLRGMMSEAELHLLRARMDAGRMRQVERGTYRQVLPTGLQRLSDGQVVKDPDRHVQKTISLLFERFEELGSAQKVLRSLRDDGVMLPRRQVAGERAGQLLWRRPNDAAIYDILRNPAYAGAFVYGRHGQDPDREPGSVRRIHKPIAEWIAVHKDVYPAYVSWEEFVAIHRRLDENGYNFAANKAGATRAGQALLSGLVFCGNCGRHMRVHYRDGEVGCRYICDGAKTSYGGPICFYLQGDPVDKAVVEAFFDAVKPSEIALLDEVLEGQQADHERLLEHRRDAAKSASYEARLAEKRYREVDPENRLVASELESGWEAALRNLNSAKEELERFERERTEPTLDPDLREQLADLSGRLPELWNSGRLKPEHKKELLRSLIERIILSRPRPDTIGVKIVWVSSAISELEVHPRVVREADLSTYEQLVARTLELVEEGYTDKVIARMLTEEGFRSARNLEGVPRSVIQKLRAKRGIPSVNHRFRSQEKVDGRWTILGLSRKLGVDRNWFYKRIKKGDIPAERQPKTGHYLVGDDPELIAALEREVIKNKGKRFT